MMYIYNHACRRLDLRDLDVGDVGPCLDFVCTVLGLRVQTVRVIEAGKIIAVIHRDDTSTYWDDDKWHLLKVHEGDKR